MLISNGFTLLTEAEFRLSDTDNESGLATRLRQRMTQANDFDTPRVYHVERHIEAVLDCLFAWTSGEPSAALVAAALYHDAVYDATRADNELLSAVFCHDELLRVGLPTADIVLATHLILLTAHHQPNQRNTDEVLLIDADLFILGSPPNDYDAYVRAIRTEYQHVSADAWRVGRKAVLESFLNRERLYRGDWPGHETHEAQARANLRREIDSLN